MSKVKKLNKEKYCKRCKSWKLHTKGLKSRWADIDICDECGVEEAEIKAEKIKATPNEKDFIIMLGKKVNPSNKDIARFIWHKRFERFCKITRNARENKREEKYMRKMKNKKVRASLTPDGEFIFPYLTNRECYGIKQVAETVKIFPNYKLAELQHWSGLSEQDFMQAMLWLSQYKFIYSIEVNLEEFIADELSEMECI